MGEYKEADGKAIKKLKTENGRLFENSRSEAQAFSAIEVFAYTTIVC